MSLVAKNPPSSGSSFSVRARKSPTRLATQDQDLLTAREHFETVLKLEPRHVEAQREMRLIDMRLKEIEQRGGLFNRLLKRVKSKREE